MKLLDALDLGRSDVVVFVGAGGKTSAMFRLADEMVQAGWRVITTTTTRIGQDEMAQAPQQIGVGPAIRLPETIVRMVEQYQHVFVFTKVEADQKVHGFRPNWLDDNLAHASFLDALLVEADGSRRLPLKAPLPHEPPIPATSSVVIPVVGLSVLGKPLNDQHVYGADIIYNLTGFPIDSQITEQLLGAVLVNPQLGLKNIPPGARVIPLLNQVTPETLQPARQVAEYALTDLHVERVLIGAVQEPEPVWEIRRRVGAIILAAGQSKRMGQQKMLLPWGDVSIIRHVCQQVCDSPVHDVIVVTGDNDEAVRAQLDGLPVRVVHNPRAAQGEMLSSLQTGIDALWDSCEACLVVLGDQPALQGDVINRILGVYALGLGRIVAPSFNRRRGHPLLIDRSFWVAMKELPKNKAPRDLLRANENAIHHVEVDDDSILNDIDTPDDYEQARRGAGLA
jgi:molybdenum cofactor cytidylyltransferase